VVVASLEGGQTLLDLEQGQQYSKIQAEQEAVQWPNIALERVVVQVEDQLRRLGERLRYWLV
jgi:hypothetical protein